MRVNEKLAEGWQLKGSFVVHGGQLLLPIMRCEKPEKRIRETSED